MIITPLKTHKILPFKESLPEILDRYVTTLPEKSVLVITSKIVAICEGRVIKIGEAEKYDLVKKEAELYLPPETNRYHMNLTIKKNVLAVNAGIDESNGNGYYILWPDDPQKAANEIRTYLAKRLGHQNCGVIMTDSKTTPLRWGVTGIAIAHSGFQALNNYIGEPDLFGHKLRVTKVNVMDGLAAGAVLAMGEGNEQTPLAVITNLPFVTFTGRDPTGQELKDLHISLEEDIYGAVLQAAPWQKGGSGEIVEK